MVARSSFLKTVKNAVYVYEFKAWSRFLFPSLCTNAIKIEAKILQSNADILKKVVAKPGYFLFHINLTKTAFFFKNKEELLTRLKNMGITPLNGEINDTSKEKLQSVCKQEGLKYTKAEREGEPEELLIIKTNLNHGGKPEKRLPRSQSRRLNLGADNYDTNIIYPVMERKKINNKVWHDENLIVEKYIANEKNFFYRVYKLLNRVVISEVIDRNLIKKMPTGIERINYYFDLDDILPEAGNSKFFDVIADIAILSNALTIDFAAFDVVKSDDNKYYIIDVNLTPNWEIDDQTEILDFLANGLYDKQPYLI